MSAVLQHQSALEQAYNRLKTSPVMSPNHNWLASMAASWCVGLSVLPDYMGLEPNQFQQLKCTYFQVDKLPEQAVSGIQLDFNRMLEKEDLVKLLTRNSRVNTLEGDWLIAIIVVGCLG
ncbi:MAG: hypothetical protein RIR39_1316, partial [Pseudomonadota bacterium]